MLCGLLSFFRLLPVPGGFWVGKKVKEYFERKKAFGIIWENEFIISDCDQSCLLVVLFVNYNMFCLVKEKCL